MKIAEELQCVIVGIYQGYVQEGKTSVFEWLYVIRNIESTCYNGKN